MSAGSFSFSNKTLARFFMPCFLMWWCTVMGVEAKSIKVAANPNHVLISWTVVELLILCML